MATTQDRFPVPAVVPELSFARAVDLALIHRCSPGEAFLTDGVRTRPGEFAAAALLPWPHPHYSAHTGPSRQRDPMLLLECARQAMTYATHAVFGAELDARLVLRNWSAEFAVGPAPAAAGPAELLMTATTRNPQLAGDQVRGLEYQVGLWIAGAWAGRVRMEVSYVSAAAYVVVRSRKHHGRLPTSEDVVPADGCPVAPARVGRLRATDTLLLDVMTGAGMVTARLRVPVENPSLFDHAQDHVPAMVLAEAARQLAGFAIDNSGGAPPERTQMAAIRSSFDVYAELNEPVEMTASTDGLRPAGQPVDVIFRQAGKDIAQAQVVMAVPA